MNRTLADLKAYGKGYMRNRSGAFFAFIFPVILILLFGAIFSNTGTKTTLNVQNLDKDALGNDSPESARLIAGLKATGALDIKMIPSDVNIDNYIRDNSLSVALLIPHGFNYSVDHNILANVTIMGDPTQGSFGVVAGVVSAVVNQRNIELLYGSAKILVRAENIGSEQFRYIDFFIPGMIGFIVLTSPMFSMASVCAEFRGRGYFKLLASTPLTKSEWLVSKILWYVLLMFSSIAVMYVVGVGVYGARVVITPIAILLIMAGTFLFTSLGMFLGIFVSNPESAAAIANAIGFPMMFLSGTFFPIEQMPDFMQKIAGVLPLTYLTQGLRATMVLGNDVTAAVDLLVVLVIGVVFFVLAARAMSWKGK